MSHTSYSVSESDRQRGKYMPWVITGFFVSFIIPLLFFVYIAFQNKPSEVTQNAYQKGLQYNKTLAAAEAQKKLGWKADIKVDRSRLEFSLVDLKNKPISKANVKAWMVRPSQAALDKEYTLKEMAKGKYESPVSLEKGLWEARVTAESGGQEFQATKTFTAR